MFFNNVPESIETNLEMLDELGGPKTYNHYAWGWTFAGNTPFRRWKRETYRGGVSDPFIVHWPAGFKAKGEIRSQYMHAIDLVPTVLEALNVEAPDSIKGVTQSPIQGLSSPTRSTMPPPRPNTLHSTSRCSGIARSTTTAGAPFAPGRERRSPSRVEGSALRSTRRR